MIIRNRDRNAWVVEVFENFRVDEDLPKHAERKRERIAAESSGGLRTANWISPGEWADGSLEVNEVVPAGRRARMTVADWVAKVLGVRRTTPKRPSGPPTGDLDPIAVFALVRSSLGEAKSYADRMQSF